MNETLRNKKRTLLLPLTALLLLLSAALIATSALAADSGILPPVPPAIFLTKWGSIGSGDGQFYSSSSVAVDGAGNVYVADSTNDRIQKFDSSGNLLLKWGSRGSGAGQFSGPYGVAVDGAGNVYVAEAVNRRIQKFDSSGNFLRMWGNGVDTGAYGGNIGFEICTVASLPCQRGSSGNGAGQFDRPVSVAVDGDGNVYVSEYSNNRIQKFDSSGSFLRMWGWGVDTGAAAFEICTVAEWSCQEGSRGSGDGQFYNPWGVAVDGDGNVYVADTLNHRIQMFDSSGNLLLKWGSEGSGAGQFSTPFGVAVDGDGNVYVADRVNHRIQMFDSSGNFLLKWGSWGSGDGQFGWPEDVAVDGDGNVYVVDLSFHRVQKFGPVTAGTAGFGSTVAVSGTTTVVGADHVAYVFDCSSLPCTLVSKLTASDAAAGFGQSVAASGTTAVVGADGAAYVFDLDGCGAACTETSKLTASDAAAGDNFGHSVAVSGTTAVVGAPRNSRGAAYVFDLDDCGAACTETSKLTASDGVARGLGHSVAVSGTTAVAGAIWASIGASTDGAAYVFDLDGCGAACTESSRLTASTAVDSQYFGHSVAASGTTVVVGSPRSPVSGMGREGEDAGAAYVFDCSSPSCTQVSRLTASDVRGTDTDNPIMSEGDQFGYSVAVSGATAVVGIPYHGNRWQGEPDSETGAAYVFDLAGCGAACTETSKLSDVLQTDLASEEKFGWSVALSCEIAVVGAEHYDMAYVFNNDADCTEPEITPSIDGILGDNEWYVSDVSVSWEVKDDESAISASSGCETTVISRDTAGKELTCEATSEGGSNSDSVTIMRDATPPTVSVTGVTEGATYILGSVPSAGCDTSDGLSGSGVATQAVLSLEGGNGSGLGSFTATCDGATDNAGNSAAVSISYDVHYEFSDFSSPVDNPPVVNLVKGGQTVPVKFSLNGDQGLDILAAGYPQSQEVPCESGAPVNDLEESSTAGSSGLSYDPATDEYNYKWKTEKAWAGTCREFTLGLADGSDHTALFQFK